MIRDNGDTFCMLDDIHVVAIETEESSVWQKYETTIREKGAHALYLSYLGKGKENLLEINFINKEK